MLIARRLNGADVTEPSVRVTCGPVVDAAVKPHLGVDVPIPTRPFERNVVVAVPPINAEYAESCVVDALALNC